MILALLREVSGTANSMANEERDEKKDALRRYEMICL
jgi:hypothetical protein